jgi:hypothetical protein
VDTGIRESSMTLIYKPKKYLHHYPKKMLPIFLFTATITCLPKAQVEVEDARFMDFDDADLLRHDPTFFENLESNSLDIDSHRASEVKAILNKLETAGNP